MNRDIDPRSLMVEDPEGIHDYIGKPRDPIRDPRPGDWIQVEEGEYEGDHPTTFAVRAVNDEYVYSQGHCSTCDGPEEWRDDEFSINEWNTWIVANPTAKVVR